MEHLLEEDELFAKHGDDDAGTPQDTKPMEPDNEPPLTARRPPTATPHANLPEPEAHFTPTSSPGTGLQDVRDGEEKLSEQETTAKETLSPAPVASSGSSETRPSIPRANPVILVGFGTGANSLLHLAAGPLRQELSEDLDGNGGGDRRRALRHGDDGECKEGEGGIDTAGDVEAGGGLLRSVLCRKGFRVGGLILVNGFASLDGQSTQARGFGERRSAHA